MKTPLSFERLFCCPRKTRFNARSARISVLPVYDTSEVRPTRASAAALRAVQMDCERGD